MYLSGRVERGVEAAEEGDDKRGVEAAEEGDDERGVSSTSRGVGSASGGGHFPVGRRRRMAVVDTGCSCRARHPRMLLSLPSFLKPSSAGKTPAAPARSTSSSSLFPSSSSTASFSTSYASSSCSNYYSYHGFGIAPKVHQQQEHLPSAKEVPAAMPAAERGGEDGEDTDGGCIEEEEERGWL
ncbi:uncharacterized protein [Triticum aestivum]|uniref:uncharacterized protein n=1 Tax=Triticum aestivum TaxID=4565 RepID=UPI001D01B2DA|nr:uncharacterized protein LOC123055684 [Triticum aestivum]